MLSGEPERVNEEPKEHNLGDAWSGLTSTGC